MTLLSSNMLEDLRSYYKEYKPKIYLFEGATGAQYSATSIQKIIKRAAKNSNIKEE